MAKKVYEEENISNIAIAIREKTGGNKTYKTSEMVDGVREVYEAGQLKTFADAESLNGNLQGATVKANDVANIEHNVPCVLTSDTITDFSQVEVSRFGKNLFEFKQGYVSGGTGSVIESLENGAICQGALSSNTQHNSWGNGWYTFANRATVNLKAGDTVTISCDYTVLELAAGRSMSDFNSNDGTKQVGIYLYNSGSGSSYAGGAVENQPAILGEPTRLYTTYTVAEDSNYHPLFTLNSNKVKIENIQIEYGSTPTTYEPFKEPTTYQSTADGIVNGITSVAPNMTLLTNAEGVIINANYYKDPDIVISNLQQAVAMSGGE